MNKVYILFFLSISVLMPPFLSADTAVMGSVKSGLGIVEFYNPSSREIVIDDKRFKVHVSTMVGQVVTWPGEYKKIDIGAIRKGDQVFFDADFTQKEPYKLEYIHRLIK